MHYHPDLSSTGSLRYDQCTSRNAHSMLHIAHARVRPQHRPARKSSNPPSQAVPIRQFQGVGTVQRAFLATMHAIAHSNPHIESKKCESLFVRCAREQPGQHELHAHFSTVGSTPSVAGKLSQLQNHNDIGGRTVQALPKETQVTG